MTRRQHNPGHLVSTDYAGCLTGQLDSQALLGREEARSNAMRPIRAQRTLFLALSVPSACSSFASVFLSVAIAPPGLPVYAQPICPGDGYLWTPGYWAYGEAGYFWVPGTWVLAPRPGVLWTPGYWGWGGGAYLWHAGYWGPARWLLRRSELRLRLWWRRLLWRPLGRRTLCLQHRGAARGHGRSSTTPISTTR